LDNIYKFCETAREVYCETKNIEDVKNLSVTIDVDKDEIYRSIWGNNDTCIFNMSLQIKGNESLHDEIKYMQTIDMFYPETFSWRYNGKHIEVIAMIPINKEHLGIFTRYRGITEFISQLRKRLIAILKFRDFNTELKYKTIYSHILSTGSINNKTGCYVVDVSADESFYDIMSRSNKKIMKGLDIRTLDMKFWVKEINPDFYKEFHHPPKMKKYSIKEEDIFSKYPPCIKKISGLPKKGNYNRFLLGTFFLGVHNERDAKHQLDVVLDDKERHHVNSGNCKDQWRAILIKNYSPPSCKTMIDAGFCDKDCGKAAPIDLEGGKE